jgi:hypothetical protein
LKCHVVEGVMPDEKWKALCQFAKTGVSYFDDPREEWDIATHTAAAKPVTRRRRPSLARAKKQAAKAGVEVARYEIGSDGTINVVPAKPEETADNPWDRVQ